MRGKTVLITGASAGIGKAAAIKLNNEGYRVYATARRVDKMKDLEALGIQCRYLDVTNDSSMTKLVDELTSKHGQIDALVNNAGYGSYGALEDVPLTEARRQIEVNLFGLARMCQLVLPAMRKQGNGKIINVSSVGGKAHEPLGAWYHASKYGVEGLSDCLRAELKPFNIKVIVIQPGAIESEWEQIANKQLNETSGKGAYAQFIHNNTVTTTRGSTDVVTNAIWKSIYKRKPKTRYVVGPMAKLTIFSRWLLSDRMMDRIITRLNHYYP